MKKNQAKPKKMQVPQTNADMQMQNNMNAMQQMQQQQQMQQMQQMPQQQQQYQQMPQQQYQQMPQQQYQQIPQQQQQQQIPIPIFQMQQMPQQQNQLFQQPMPQSTDINAIFNDDEPLKKEKVKMQTEGQQVKIQLDIKAQRSMVKLGEACTLPAMCSLKTSGGSRTNVDLICVMDVSGSMSGPKIQLVRDTMMFLIETLSDQDRLCLITFESYGNRLCPLQCVTPSNMTKFSTIIKSIQSGGGTNINAGLDLALKVIRERKQINNVTSIFLLSDGQDGGADQTFKKTLQLPINKEINVFSIHSFGFGDDHDEKLMTNISKIKDGSFYYIKQLATLDQAFCNALGGIISLVANQVTIKVSNVAKNKVQNITIGQTYGNMWIKNTQKQYSIKLLQIMTGISKDYVFELNIPAIEGEVGDVDRNHNVLEGMFMAKKVDGKNLTGQCSFKITLLNKDENIPQENENVDVIENHLRVRAAKAIEENMKKAQLNQFQQAQQGLQTMITSIQGNHKARKEKMNTLVQDLQLVQSKCSKKDYQNQGKKWGMHMHGAHSKQANFQYSNQIQSNMVYAQKAKKKP